MNPDTQSHVVDRDLPRELAHRSSAGADIVLLWYPADDRLEVLVDAAPHEASFRIPIEDGRRPLEVFQHAFAYAAFHGRVAPAPQSLEPRGERVPMLNGRPFRVP
jgi:hypothetical protein